MASDYSRFKLADSQEGPSDYSRFKPFVPPTDTGDETARLAARYPKPLRDRLIETGTDALLGVGDVVRGIGNARSKILRGVTGGHIGEPEQVPQEGRQLGDYVGEIGTDVAVSAVPVTKASQGIQAVGRMLPNAVARLLPAGMLGSNVLANAGYAAATTDQDRGTAALMGGGASGAGHVLSKTLGRVAGQSREVADWLKSLPQQAREAIEPLLTPGQQGGAISRHLENAAHNFPIAQESIDKARSAAVKAWNEALEADLRAAAIPDPSAINTAQDLTDILGKRGAPPTLPSEVAARTNNPELLDLANKAKAVLEGYPKSLPTSVLPLSLGAIGTFTPAGASAAAGLIVPILYGSPMGRKVLLGQYPMQKFLAENPQIASQVSRAIATQQGE